MAEGMIVRLSNGAAAGQPSVLVDDVNNATDGPDHGRVQAGAIYVAAQGSTDLVMAGDVARSFEVGAIRGFIDAGVLTAEVVLGDAAGTTQVVVVDHGTTQAVSAAGKVTGITVVSSGALNDPATINVEASIVAASILDGAAAADVASLDGASDLTLAATAADVVAGEILTLTLVSAALVARATVQISFAGADA